MKTERGCTLTQEQICGAIAFHGHHCPGLTIGMRAAEWCLRELGHDGDEDIVVITETDMCADDAVQYLTGCTFGKGNFRFRDTGKVVFTFFRRRDLRGGRLALNPDFAADLRETMERIPPEQKSEIAAVRSRMIERMTEAPLEALFRISTPEGEIPSRARLHRTLRCERCGEGVMESRMVTVGGKSLCTDCAENAS